MRMAMLILASAAAAALAAGPASARADETTNVRDRDTARIIVLTDEHRDGRPEAGAAGDHVRVYSLDRDHLVDCGADRRVIERSSPDGREHSKVVLCTRGEEVSAEERSTRLEHVMERIQHMDGLSESSKERVTAALRGAIEELRNAH